MAATSGWQVHSCRAFLTGLRKQGRALLKEQRRNGDTAYRLERLARVKNPVTDTAVQKLKEPGNIDAADTKLSSHQATNAEIGRTA